MAAGSITDADSLAQAWARGATMKRDLLQREGGVLSVEAFASRIGLSASDLAALPLLWLDIDGERAYPAFQILNDEMLPGIAAVVEAFAIDEPWMQLNFMLTGDARLGGKRPIDALREGHIGEVIEAARAYGEHGAA